MHGLPILGLRSIQLLGDDLVWYEPGCSRKTRVFLRMCFSKGPSAS